MPNVTHPIEYNNLSPLMASAGVLVVTMVSQLLALIFSAAELPVLWLLTAALYASSVQEVVVALV